MFFAKIIGFRQKTDATDLSENYRILFFLLQKIFFQKRNFIFTA